MDKKIITISNWEKRSPTGQVMKQVVVHTPNGKKVNGKPAIMSITKHIPA